MDRANGLKLGMPLAAVEKVNKKPFNVRAFNGENAGYVTSWDGGASLAPRRLQGHPRVRARPEGQTCRSGAPLDGNKEYPSGHPGMKAAKSESRDHSRLLM